MKKDMVALDVIGKHTLEQDMLETENPLWEILEGRAKRRQAAHCNVPDSKQQHS